MLSSYVLYARAPDSPAKSGNGKDCDEEMVEEAPCGSKECTECIIDGVVYAVGQVISVEACNEMW